MIEWLACELRYGALALAAFAGIAAPAGVAATAASGRDAGSARGVVHARSHPVAPGPTIFRHDTWPAMTGAVSMGPPGGSARTGASEDRACTTRVSPAPMETTLLSTATGEDARTAGASPTASEMVDGNTATALLRARPGR